MFDVSIIPIESCSQVDSTMVDPNDDCSIHHDKEPLVFPPINHENLQILSSDANQHVPHTPPPFDSHVRGWIGMGFHILRSKISSLRERGAIWSIGVSAAALLMSCWIISSLRKKRTLTPKEARLINIIKDKDGKIAQLLHQIAEMNEILIDRHKTLAAKVGD